MNTFVETVSSAQQFELCGRIIRERDALVIFIDDVGKFSLSFGVVTAIILGLGAGNVSGPIPGVAYRSVSGKGFYLTIGGVSYVTPISRVRAVMDGVHRKGPVSRVREIS